MIKQFFNALLSKKDSVNESEVPVFKITENAPVKSDFEVTELSYEEYVRIVGQDRRQATTYVSHERRNLASNT